MREIYIMWRAGDTPGQAWEPLHQWCIHLNLKKLRYCQESSSVKVKGRARQTSVMQFLSLRNHFHVSRPLSASRDFEFEAHLALKLGIYLCSLSLTSLSWTSLYFNLILFNESVESVHATIRARIELNWSERRSTRTVQKNRFAYY